MRNWLAASKIISAVLMVLFAGTSLLIAFGKREKVLAVVYRIFGEKERYDDEKAARVLQGVFAVFAVLELLNLVFAKTAAVPAVCIPAALIICYLSLLYMDRRCRKKRKDEIPLQDAGTEIPEDESIVPFIESEETEDASGAKEDVSDGQEEDVSGKENASDEEEEGIPAETDESDEKEDGIPVQDDESYEKEETGREMENE